MTNGQLQRDLDINYTSLERRRLFHPVLDNAFFQDLTEFCQLSETFSGIGETDSKTKRKIRLLSEGLGDKMGIFVDSREIQLNGYASTQRV